MSKKDPVIIGLTGGIGSGKSTAAAFFEELGFKQIDLDAISRRLQYPGQQGYKNLVKTFGEEIVLKDGSDELDRPFLRDMVFSYPECKNAVEAIMEPLIFDEYEKEVLNLSDEKIVILNSPLIIESFSWRSKISKLIVVDCDKEDQIDRVSKRSGLSRDLILKIIKNQATREERLKYAAYKIDNSKYTDLKMLKLQVAAVAAQILLSFS